MNQPENALSLTIVGSPDFGIEVLKSLYRITGRSTVELRRAILAGDPVYTAALFGNDHIHVVPRLEKTIGFLDEHGVSYIVHELIDGESQEITLGTMREIVAGAEGDFS